MQFLEDAFSRRAENGPGGSYGTGSLAPSSSFPVIEFPDIAPPRAGASELISEGWSRVTAPVGPIEGVGDLIQGAGNRLGGALEIGAGLLSKPQEMVTQALFGQEYATPSAVPELREFFTMGGVIPPSIAGFAADIALDPLNLVFGAGAVGDVFSGAVKGAKMIDSAQELRNLNMLARGGDSLFFKSLDDLHNLQKAAGTSFPAKFDDVTGYYTYDLDKSFSLNVGKDVERLKEATKGFHVHQIDDIENEHFLGTPTKDWKEKELGLFSKVFANPRFWGDFTKASIQTLTDGSKARTAMVKSFKEDVQRLLPDIPFKGADNPLSRAFMYTAYGESKALAKDAAARSALEHYGEEAMKTQAKAYKQLVINYAKMAPNVKLGEEVTLQQVLKSMGHDPKESHIIPHDLKKVFGAGEALNPLTADLLEMNNAFILKASKSAYVDPAISAIEDLIKKNPDKLKKSEKVWIEAILRNQKGVPDAGDKLLVSHVLNSRETWRKYIWGEKLLEADGSLKEGVDYAALRGPRAYAGRKLEKLIGRAERKDALLRESLGKARSHVYSALLGAAIDTAARNLTQTTNVITEVGLRQTLESVGAQLFNRKWKEHLKAENVVDRTQSYLSSIFEDQVFEGKSSWMRKIMAPMEIVENFNRGVAYHASLSKNLQKGMKFDEASLTAEDFVRKVHFGYSNLDVSPYLDNSYAKMFSQFMVYPVRQTELLFKWATEPDGTFRNKLIRHLVLTGGIVSYGQHLGVDMSNVLGVGFSFSQYPPYVSWSPDQGMLLNPASMTIPAVYRATADTLAGVVPFMKAITGSDPNAWGQTKDQGWKALASAIRVSVPGGRFALKGSKDFLELISMSYPEAYRATKVGAAPGAGWVESVQDTLLYKWAKVSGVDVDPGVNVHDRLVRILGFNSTHDRARREERDFLANYIKEQRRAVADLNDTVLSGGNLQERQAYWVRRFRKNLGSKMQELNVPDYILYNQIKPSDASLLKRKFGKLSSTSNEQIIQSMPKDVKNIIKLQEEYW